MMTSRAEYRIFLRQDNADMRLTEIGHKIGLIDEKRYSAFAEKRKAIEEEKERLRTTHLPPSEKLHEILNRCNSTLTQSGISLLDLIKRPEIHYADLAEVDKKRPELPPSVVFAVEVDIKYEGYLALEEERIRKFMALENKKLSPDIPYDQISGLRLEARSKLMQRKPMSLGQASRISGVSPAVIAVLLVYLEAKKSEALEERKENG